MAPPINKSTPKLRISSEVMDAAQTGKSVSKPVTREQSQAAIPTEAMGKQTVLNSLEPDYTGRQVARGVKGAEVRANPNVISAIVGDRLRDPDAPLEIRPTGPINEPGRLVDGYATSALSETPDYMSGGQRTIPFKPEYESARVPGDPLSSRFVNRVDMEPEKSQLYTGPGGYADETDSITNAAERAYFNTQVGGTGRNTYTKVTGGLTPEQMSAIETSLVDGGVDRRAFGAFPDGLKTYKKPEEGAFELPAIAPVKSRMPYQVTDTTLMPGNLGTYRVPGNPEIPGRDARLALPGKNNDGFPRYKNKADNSIDQQNQMLLDYENYTVPSERVGGDYGVGESNASVIGSSYGYPKKEDGAPGPLANLGVAPDFKGDRSLMYDVNQDPANGVNIGSGLKSGAGQEYSPQDVLDIVNGAMSKQDMLDASYDLKAYNKPQKEALRSEGRDGKSSVIATRNALSALEAAGPYFEVRNYRTVDPNEMGLMGFLKDYDMEKPSVLAPLPSTKVLDPNFNMATGSVATRGVVEQQAREALAKGRSERSYQPAGIRNENSPGYGLPPDQNEYLVPGSDGSLVTAPAQPRRANPGNVTSSGSVADREWLRENYPQVYDNMDGATSYSSIGVDQTPNQLLDPETGELRGYGDDVLSKNKTSSTLERYLDRGPGVDDRLGKTGAYVASVDLPGRNVGDTGVNRVYLGSSVPVAASQSDTGEAGYTDNWNPRSLNRQQTMLNPMTGKAEPFEMTDIPGENPPEYLATMRRAAGQQQMALMQATAEHHRRGGIVKDEYNRPLPPNMDVVGFNGETLYDSAVKEDLALGLPPRETVYDLAKQIHGQVSPGSRGGGIDPIFDQLPEHLLLQGNATKDMNLRVQDTEARINALSTGTAEDNIKESTALSFVGPDGRVRTSVQRMPPSDQMRIQGLLTRVDGMAEMQNQYSAQNERGSISALQGPRMDDPVAATKPLNQLLNKGEITRDEYDLRLADNVARYVEGQAADPYVRKLGPASDQPARAEEGLPSREQIAYGSPGIMPGSMTTRPDPGEYMRQAPGGQYSGNRDTVNSVVQVNPDRALQLGAMGQRPRLASRTLTGNESIPQTDLDAADAFSQQIYMSSERRKRLEELGRQGQRG